MTRPPMLCAFFFVVLRASAQSVLHVHFSAVSRVTFLFVERVTLEPRVCRRDARSFLERSTSPQSSLCSNNAQVGRVGLSMQKTTTMVDLLAIHEIFT